MENPSESIRNVARLLLEAEGAARNGSDVNEAVLACRKLRDGLAKFAGPDGFKALSRRALALARTEIPALKTATLDKDGCIADFEDLDGSTGAAAGEAFTTHLLGLLTTFVGEPMTLRLVRQAWPEIYFDDSSNGRRR